MSSVIISLENLVDTVNLTGSEISGYVKIDDKLKKFEKLTLDNGNIVGDAVFEDVPDSPSAAVTCGEVFKNRDDGNCLFDAIAQVYYNEDLSDRVKNLSQILRNIVSKAVLFQYYRKALNQEVKKIIDSIGNTIDVGLLSLREQDKQDPSVFREISRVDPVKYSEEIQKDKTWGSDIDIAVLYKLINTFATPEEQIGFILKNTQGTGLIQDTFNDPPISNPYTLCYNGNHYLLEKHANPRNINTITALDEHLFKVLDSIINTPGQSNWLQPRLKELAQKQSAGKSKRRRIVRRKTNKRKSKQ
jgi:hypothetical protein